MSTTDRQRKLVVHVDLDSPRVLLQFYGHNPDAFADAALDSFYMKTFKRMLAFFERHGIKASLFTVGSDLDRSKVFCEVLSEAVERGHEAANHTWSHPFGLALLEPEAAKREIIECNAIIADVTGQHPIGFRSPGYSMNNRLMATLADEGFKYDSSGFWSVMNPVMSAARKTLYRGSKLSDGFGDVTRRLPRAPYRPSALNWTLADADQGLAITELPLPRAPRSALPFYHNFNLWLPPSVAYSVARSMRQPELVYLFHLIEFADPDDELPAGIMKHPNVRKPYARKEAVADRLMGILKHRYDLDATREILHLPFRTH